MARGEADKFRSEKFPVPRYACSHLTRLSRTFEHFSLILSDFYISSNHSKYMPVSSKSDGLYSTLIGIKLTKPRFLQMAEERMQKATFTCLPQEKKFSLDKMLFGLRISSNVLYIWLLFFVYRCSKALAVENKIRTRTCCLIEIRRKNQNIY